MVPEEDEEFEPRLLELMDEAFEGESEDLNPSIDHLFNLVKPAPRTVPRVLNLKPSEFMEAPIEHFQALCEEHTYTKVISSLTYIRNVASGDNEDVIKRAKSLQEDLKRWRTTASKSDQNKQDDPPAS